MLKVASLQNNPFGEHTYVVSNPATNDAVVIDPGMLTSEEREKFDKYLKTNNLKLTGIVNTHLHLDHCFGANYVSEKYGVGLSANSDDAFLGESMAEQSAGFGMPDAKNVTIDVQQHEGDRIHIGDDYLEVIHTPGHTPGGLCFYSPVNKFLISGDTLFKQSVGRTDLPGGNHRSLNESIKKKLFALPDDTLVLPGHGPHTSIGFEKTMNPFLT